MCLACMQLEYVRGVLVAQARDCHISLLCLSHTHTHMTIKLLKILHLTDITLVILFCFHIPPNLHFPSLFVMLSSSILPTFIFPKFGPQNRLCLATTYPFLIYIYVYNTSLLRVYQKQISKQQIKHGEVS